MQPSEIWGTEKDLLWPAAWQFLRAAPLDEDTDAPFCILEGSNGTARILPFEYRYSGRHYDPWVIVDTGRLKKQMRLRLTEALAILGPNAKYTLRDIRMNPAPPHVTPQFNDRTKDFL